ncbi:MAG: hypothetical protein M0Z57_07085 [Deltaproteobacteria bacterium]|jgi:hypothetical protein|nr:hypothetical protein [Deltaproteobacteria bacterium]
MIQLFDGYLNKFYDIAANGFTEIKSAVSGEPLAVLSETIKNKSYSFSDSKRFRKFYKKYSKTRSLSVFQNKNDYVIFSENNKAIQNIYEQYGVEPFPYQIFFLQFLKTSGIKEPAILIEFLDNGRIGRVTTAFPQTSISVETAGLESPVMFQNFIREKIGRIKKTASAGVKLFVLGKGGQALLPDASVLGFDDLFNLDVSSYVFEEPIFKIKTQKSRELKSAAGIFITSLLILIFSIFVYNGFKTKTEVYLTKAQNNAAMIQKLKTKLRIASGKRFLYELNKSPDYAAEITKLLKLFPQGAYVKKISLKGNYISLTGYTDKSYREFVRVFNILKSRLRGYVIFPVVNSKANFRFIIRGKVEKN